MVNYPFVYASAKQNAPQVFRNMGVAKYPKVVDSIESKPPLGGINVGVSAFSANKQLAFEAVECLVQPDNQLAIARASGLPPVLEDLYDRPVMDEIYPGFADLIRESIQDAAPRPSESPAYQDVSLAIQRALHPVTAIDASNPTTTYRRLREPPRAGDRARRPALTPRCRGRGATVRDGSHRLTACQRRPLPYSSYRPRRLVGRARRDAHPRLAGHFQADFNTATAVLVDVTIIRMVLVPAIMQLLAPTGGCPAGSTGCCRREPGRRHAKILLGVALAL